MIKKLQACFVCELIFVTNLYAQTFLTPFNPSEDNKRKIQSSQSIKIMGQSVEAIERQYGKPQYTSMHKENQMLSFEHVGEYNFTIFGKKGVIEKVEICRQDMRPLSELEIQGFLQSNKEGENEDGEWQQKRKEFHNVVYYFEDGQKIRAYLRDQGSSISIVKNIYTNNTNFSCYKENNYKPSGPKMQFQIGKTKEDILRKNGPPKGFFGNNTLTDFNGYEVGFWEGSRYFYEIFLINDKIEQVTISQGSPFSNKDVQEVLDMYKINQNDEWKIKNKEFIYTCFWLEGGDSLRAYLSIDSKDISIVSKQMQSILRSGFFP